MPTTKDAPKLSLPVNHPQAGYISPDLSLQDSVGTLPEEEQEYYDDLVDAQTSEAEAVAEAEDKAAKALIEPETTPAPKPAAKAPDKSTS